MIARLITQARLNPFATAIGIAVAAGLACMIYWAPWPANSSEFAAWFQAVGAVGAILAAVGVANYQARKTRQAALDAEKQLELRELSSLVVLLEGCDNIAKVIVARCEEQTWKTGNIDYAERVCDRLLRQLEGVHLRNLPGASSREAAVRSSIGLETLLAALGFFRQMLPSQPARTSFSDTASALATTADTIKKEYVALCEKWPHLSHPNA